MLRPLSFPRAPLVPVVAVALLLLDCSRSPGDKSSPPAQTASTGPSFSKDIQPIFDNNCVACHQAGSAQQGLVLEPGKSFANIVGIKSRESALKLVAAGTAGQSYLLLKIEGKQQQVGGTGAQMPLGDALTPAQSVLVRQWIEAGARDN